MFEAGRSAVPRTGWAARGLIGAGEASLDRGICSEDMLKREERRGGGR